MEKTIKINAKSELDAKKQAQDKFNLKDEEIKVRELESPKSGFLGIFGNKEGVYELTIKVEEDSEKGSTEKITTDSSQSSSSADISKEEISFDSSPKIIDMSDKPSISDEEEIRYAKEFIETLLDKANINADVSVTKDKNIITVNITGEEASYLIGRRGDTLDSIQFLTGLALNKVRKDSQSRVLVDIEDYRSKREESLKRYANRVAREVAKSRRAKKLDFMNPYERRIVHSELQYDKFVITYSEGNDPYRRVVIEPKQKKRYPRDRKPYNRKTEQHKSE